MFRERSHKLFWEMLSIDCFGMNMKKEEKKKKGQDLG